MAARWISSISLSLSFLIPCLLIGAPRQETRTVSTASGPTEQKLWQLSLSAPQSQAGQAAAAELLTLAKKNPKRANEICERLLLEPHFQLGSLGKELRDLRDEQSYRGILHGIPEAERAKRFGELYKRNPQGSLAKRTLFRAVHSFEQQGALDDALGLFQFHLTLNPADPDRSYIRQEMLRISDRALLWSQAKIYVEELLLLEPDAEQRKDWRSLLCRYDQLMAPTDAEMSCSLGAHWDIEKGVQWAFALSMQARGEVYRMSLYLRQQYLIRSDLSLEERLRALQALAGEERLGLKVREEAAQEMLQLYAENLKNLSPEAREMIAALAYQSLRNSYQTFERMVIQANDREGFLTALQSQKQAFDELERLSRRVWKIEDPRWGSLVLLEMAQAALHFSEQLQNPPSMESVDTKQLEAELKTREAGLKAKAKAQLATAEKVLARYGVLQESNRRVVELSRSLRESPVQFEDRFPAATWVSYDP